MNCFDEATIQRYVDGECSESESEMLSAHFKQCTECMVRFEMQQQRSVKIKSEVNSLLVGAIEIPDFVPHEAAQKVIFPFRRKLTYGLAAASVLLILVLLVGKYQTNRTDDTIIYYSFDYEVDANKPITSQDMVLYYTDENGDTYESVVN